MTYRYGNESFPFELLGYNELAERFAPLVKAVAIVEATNEEYYNLWAQYASNS